MLSSPMLTLSRNLEAEMAMLLDLERPVLLSNTRLYKFQRLLTSCKVVFKFVTIVVVLLHTVENNIQLCRANNPFRK
jgi:hypothetical protein